MNSGSLAAKTINQIFQEPEREEEARVRYEAGYRRFLDVVFSFVNYFYDASKDKEAYWGEAKALMDPIGTMSARQDFVYLISGLGGVHALTGLDADQALATLRQIEEEAKRQMAAAKAAAENANGAAPGAVSSEMAAPAAQ